MKKKILSIAILSIVLMLEMFNFGYIGTGVAEEEEGKKYAIVVGVENYERMDTNEFAKNDAQDMSDFLKNKGWEVTKLDDATEEQVTNALEDLKSKAKPEDKVWIYFSAHTGGIEEEEEEEEESDGYDEILCTKDTNPANYEKGITDDELKEHIESITSEHIVVVIDSCDAGGYMEICKESGCIVLGACEEGQTANFWSTLENGVYTYYLLEELNKGLSVEEAHTNAKKKTADFVKYHMKEEEPQEPVMKDEYDGEYDPAAYVEDGFGGIVVPVDKLTLLVPYIGLASTILVATIVTAISVKRVKRRKEKQ